MVLSGSPEHKHTLFFELKNDGITAGRPLRRSAKMCAARKNDPIFPYLCQISISKKNVFFLKLK